MSLETRVDELSGARRDSEPAPANDVSSRFGRRLRELRRQNELTQSDMARKFGIDRSYISDVERGRKSISLSLLEVIALGLQISLSDLFRDI
jgi:transcriptional regulator with XRE-family HTH domain